ncbi:hypothetical protein LCGC14_2482860 [marine sediment metagenome]|uniref:Uncharacterized protein n=1 Tax=marine sediment metagenome TaxID=412755 RepID=A0A0F9DJ35_9ZZZZ
MIAFDKNVEWILGRPCFVCGPIAHRLNELGHNIKPHAEEEQAAVIYWMLCLYEEHGEGWKKKAGEELQQALKEE